jgi:hypothetical protein
MAAEGKSKDVKKELPKLGVKCTDSDCAQGLHAFRPKRGTGATEVGSCRDCEAAELVDWERVHQRDPADFGYLRKSFDKELIRHTFWALELPGHIRDLAIRPRRGTLEEVVEQTLRRSIGPPASALFRDGIQTPFPDNPNARISHYGQHATGTCCRKCLAYWHGIATEVPLGEIELNYTEGLVHRFIDEKLGN